MDDYAAMIERTVSGPLSIRQLAKAEKVVGLKRSA